ncbi:MAG: cytochrome C, partial [Bacteroidota bacterium]
QGTYITRLPANDKGEGVFIFRASYKDRGANGLPSIASEETFTLRNPAVNPHAFDEFKDVNKMSFGGNRFVMPTKSGSYVALKQVDLTGIAEVEIMAVAPKSPQISTEGATIEVREDSPTGKLVGSSEFIGDTGAGFAPKASLIKLQPSPGMHDYYFVFANPKAKGGNTLLIMMNTTFKSTGATAAAAAAPVVAADPAVYVGKYKMTGLPFSHVEISVKDGKLMMDAGGQGGEIKPTSTADKYDADGKATLTFLRAEDNKVNKLKMEAMGFTFEGVKE